MQENEEGDWEFIDPDSEAGRNPYYEKFLVGDLNKLYLEEDEQLDEEIAKWNEKAHVDYMQKHGNNIPRPFEGEDFGEHHGGGGGWEEEE